MHPAQPDGAGVADQLGVRRTAQSRMCGIEDGENGDEKGDGSGRKSIIVEQ